MQWQEWSDVIPPEELQSLDKGRQQEIEQPLIDLGYLSGLSDLRLHATQFQQSFYDAIQHFRADYFAIGLQPDSAIHLLRFPTHELDSLELNLLHQLTGLDGEMEIPEVPIVGQKNLWTRVLHYRLMVLGLFTENVDAPFGEKSWKAIEQLGIWLKISVNQSLEIIQLSGHVPSLTAKLLETDALRKYVVAFRYKSSTVGADLLQEVEEEDADEEDEMELSRMEDQFVEVLEEVDKEMLSDEEARWEKIEHKSRRKQNRINRIEDRMNKILIEVQSQLTGSLTIEVSLQNQINQLREQEKSLNASLKQSEREINQQKEKVNLQNANSKKVLKEKENEKKDLLKNLDNPKDIPSVLALIAQATQNNQIRNQNIQHLKQRNGKKEVIKMFEEEIKKSEKEISDLQGKIIKLKQVQKLDDDITLLKNSVDAFNEEQHKLDIFEEEKRKTEDLIKKVQKEIKSTNNSLTDKIEERQTRIGAQQLRLQDLNARLKKLLEKVNGLSYRFKAQLKRSLESDYYDELRVKVFRDRRTDYLESIAKEPFNLFLIRLIQVRQWMNGYYYGRLDSQPADRTFQSIVEFTEEEDLPNLRLKYILTKLGQEQNGFWLLNAQYYFECLVKLDAASGTENAVDLIAIYEENMEQDKSIYNNDNTKKAWEEYTLELKEGLDGSEHRIRRFYYGVKSLARTIGRMLNRIIRFIIKGAKIVLRILKNFIKIIYKEIREGTRNFIDGMKFLFSKRTIETMCVTGSGKRVLTDYDFDFDVTVFMDSARLPKETLDLHIQNCMSRTSNLHFSLTLCGKVLKWVFTIATGSFTWPRLAIKIAFYFKRMIMEYFRERKKRKRLKPANL